MGLTVGIVIVGVLVWFTPVCNSAFSSMLLLLGYIGDCFGLWFLVCVSRIFETFRGAIFGSARMWV